ncbi:hypothetical protein DdX_15912 [Ditylenchus destructor]|uniref:Uncharacterized protein n=1 Tax=Ditylenchus destructor TaxID=166010 RepID=A0AAD4QUC4_9BILA|nr:hypothetical protein DdX_15912 [Ditylenchus destructor]
MHLYCKCGHKFDNNCAHFLSDYAIEEEGIMKKLTVKCPKSVTPTQGGVYNCEEEEGVVVCMEGRRIRAKDVLAWFVKNRTEVTGSEKKNTNYWIWTDSGAAGHVYYGTEDTCVAGTGVFRHNKIRYFK